MPNPIYDGAVQIGGAFRGYVIGRIPYLRTAIRHYTVGVNSIGTCGRDFQLLQARNGVLYQGAEVDCVNYGAGMPWNWNAVHIEAEWHPTYNADEPILNDAMIYTLAGFADWLENEWGIRQENSYHGYVGRITEWDGWIDHCWLIQSGDWHYNYWPIDQWQRVAGGGPQKKENNMEPGLFVDAEQRCWIYDPNQHTKTRIMSMEALAATQTIRSLNGLPTDLVRNPTSDFLLADARDIATFAAVTPPSSGGGGTVDVEAVAQRTRAVFAENPLR